MIAALFASLLLAGCGDENVYNSANPVDNTDTDGDGLSDVEELSLGTSPRLADTDGDAFTDFEEVIEYGFNPANNNFRFNPLIADVPKLAVDIVSVPAVSLKYETTSNEKVVRGVERSTESATTVATSDTSTNSIATEQTHTVGVEVGYEAGLLGGASGSVNYEYSTSTTTEASFSHTLEQRDENRRALTESEAFEESAGIKNTGGELEVSLRIRNDGDLAFRLDNLILGAVMVDPINPDATLPIGNLNLDSSFTRFPSTTRGPGQSTGAIVFENAELNLGEAKSLLRDANGLIVDIALSEVVDEQGVGFAFNRTEIGAKTATIIIDYGGYLPSERYLVATNVNQQTQRVQLQDVLENILRAPYQISGAGELSAFRGIEQNLAVNAYWVVVHVTDNGIEQTASTYYPAGGEYDLNSLSLKSGDVLQFTFMEDADDDGLGLRQEFLIGTSPNLSDTDGDDLSDGEELNGFELAVDKGDGQGRVVTRFRSDPKIADTDGDGVSDFDEYRGVNPSNPNAVDTDSDGMLDDFDRKPTIFQSLDLGDIKVVRYLGNEVSTPPAIELQWQYQPSLDSGEILGLLVLRQEIDIGDLFVELNDIETGQCADGSICYEKLVDADTFPSSSIVDSNDFGPLGLSFDKDYRYLFYAKVDGNPVFLDSVTVNTSTAQQSITLNVSELYVDLCIDRFNASAGEYNLVCELFWDFKIDGQVLASRPEADTFDARTEQSINPVDTMTFDVADVPGSCFTFRAEIWESDTSIVSTRTGADDQLRPISATYCHPNWGSDLGTVERVSDHFEGSATNYENIEVTLFYDIALNP